MNDYFERLHTLIGREAFGRLQQKRIILFGVGGVGGFCAEALVRSGVLNITIVDDDVVHETNINRQLPALISTIGRSKVDVLVERFHDISPECSPKAMFKRYTEESAKDFDLGSYDIVIDAIDSLSSKIHLLIQAYEAGCTVYSSMGAAWKLDPTQVRVASIWQTKGCPLGKLVRTGLRERGFTGDFKAVYSEEKRPVLRDEETLKKPSILGSAMPVTSMFGAVLASQVLLNA